MSLRQKLLLMFSLTVIIVVATVGWTVSIRVRQVFEQLDQRQTEQLVSQFQHEFDQRANSVADTLDLLAASETMIRIAQEMSITGDASPFVTEADSLAKQNKLDYLELVGIDGSIISSAQWPARFGYKEAAAGVQMKQPFLKFETLADGSNMLGLFAVRQTGDASRPMTLVGGRRLDASFLAGLPVPAGMAVYLYPQLTERPDQVSQQQTSIAAGAGDAQGELAGNASPVHYRVLIEAARNSGQPASGLVYLTRHREDSVNATAIPLKSNTGTVLAVLVVANSRRGMVEVQRHIRAIALGVAAGGILLAIAASLWMAARVSGPIERLARAAEQVAHGQWNTHVEVGGNDEVGILGASFNHMTSELASQRERLIQTERVAAWRELARRLAHELKNPLFPLQLTVENLTRARSLPADEFDEVFQESTRTLSMEIANLKKIIGRFSDFSKMPAPELKSLDLNDALKRVYALYRLPSGDRAGINMVLDTESAPLVITADPELLHRALSNLVLNAMDAMQTVGTLTLTARCVEGRARIRVADTGKGMTTEERERIFTPYYTTKEFGTGLGLAIVQSVIADHHGTISVEDTPGGGTTFVIDLALSHGALEAE